MQELKDHFLTHQEENKKDEEEYPGQEDPIMEKVLGNALKVITFKPEGVQRMISYNSSVIKKEILLNILRMKLREPMQ